jgi:hypothetical protein
MARQTVLPRRPNIRFCTLPTTAFRFQDFRFSPPPAQRPAP